MEGRRSEVERLGRYAWALVGIGLALFVLGLILREIAWVIAPAVVTVVLAVLAAPMTRGLQRSGLGRGFATLFAFLILVGAIAGFAVLVGPAFTRQVGELGVDMPETAERLADRLDNLAQRLDDVAPAASQAVERFQEAVVERADNFGEDLANAIVGLVGSAVGFVTAFLIGLVVAILIVKDLPSYSERARGWLDRPGSERMRGAGGTISRTTTGFIRGQLLAAFLVGALKTLALWLLGIPYFVPLGVLSGVANLVPGVGPVVAAIPPVLIAWSRGGVLYALLVLAVLTVIQLADWYWFQPALVGTVHELPTLIVIVALIVGAGIAGLGGLIVAIPVAAAIRDAFHWYFIPDDELDDELARLAAPGFRRARRRIRRGARRTRPLPSADG